MLTGLLLGMVAAQVATIVLCAVWLERRLQGHLYESVVQFRRHSDSLLDSTAAQIAEAMMESRDGPPESDRHLASVSGIPPR